MLGVADGDFLMTGAGWRDGCLEEPVLLGGFPIAEDVEIGIGIGIRWISCKFTNCTCS